MIPYPAFFIISLTIIGIGIWYHKNKKDIFQEMLLALFISFIWVVASGLYNYHSENYFLLGINLFPFIAWSGGLILTREIYEEIRKKNKNIWKSRIFTYSIYLVAIIILEWIGYNLLKIQLASGYSGLLGLELMHMPFFGKFFYLTAGLMFLLVTDFFMVD